jgi:hypothetical protein
MEQLKIIGGAEDDEFGGGGVALLGLWFCDLFILLVGGLFQPLILTP